ncbi:hypothetical protein OIU85_017744 [Salix viminalis]|uniref:Uncharacterized protein n=1 Tax=Salix viminalis TaxID=40686 RepID=A0A9Q0V8M2_SALVM|nr:hypothetical protein OIU85_017744 [Salix viminalis]
MVMEGRRSCEGEEGSSSIGSAILGADGSSQESEKLTDVEQRGEEGSWEMGLQGRRGELGDGYAIWEERFRAKKKKRRELGDGPLIARNATKEAAEFPTSKIPLVYSSTSGFSCKFRQQFSIAKSRFGLFLELD